MKRKMIILSIALAAILTLGIYPKITRDRQVTRVSLGAQAALATGQQKYGWCSQCGIYYPAVAIQIQCGSAAFTTCIETGCVNGFCDY